jgi:rhamnulokinase
MEKVYVAFDLGATSWRAFLGREIGQDVKLEEIFREENTPFQEAGGLFWNIEKIFRGIKGVLKRTVDHGIQLAAIGIDSWSVDYGLVDEQGLLLEPPRCYRDPRNRGMMKKLFNTTDIRKLFLKTGLLSEDITTLCQLLAALEHTPALLEKAFMLLFIPDLIRFWLCGEWATDFTLATTSQLYNLTKRCWDRELFSHLGIPSHFLPGIVYGSSVLATLSKEIQNETGLGAVPVTTGASHDTAAAFSTVESDEQTAILSSGTWSMLGLHMDHPVFPDSINPERFGYEGNPDGTVRLLCNIPGMWILEQCRSVWKKRGIPCSYDLLMRGAEESEGFKSRIDPYDQHFVLPEDMTEAVQIYCRKTGQREPVTPYEHTRAIFLGLADAYADALREIMKITQRDIKKLLVIGGGSQHQFLNRLISETTGAHVQKGFVEATAVGNILNQKYALEKLH